MTKKKLQEENKQLIKNKKVFEEYVLAQKSKIDNTEKELAETKEQYNDLEKVVRGQTEADILLNAFKAVGIIKEDKPEKVDYAENHRRLSNQMQAMGARQMASSSPGMWNGVKHLLGG